MRFFGRDEVEDLRAAAEIDLGYLADAVVALDGSTTGRYANGVGAYEAARDALDHVEDCAAFEGICARIAAGRFELAYVMAKRDHVPRPASATPCLFDPAHGPYDHFVAWTPPGLDPRTVPVCTACGAIVEAGGQPEPRRVTHGENAVPFWDAPTHFAHWVQGYFGQSSECYPVRLLAGFPLGGEFAEPSGDDDVITADELFRHPSTS